MYWAITSQYVYFVAASCISCLNFREKSHIDVLYVSPFLYYRHHTYTHVDTYTYIYTYTTQIPPLPKHTHSKNWRGCWQFAFSKLVIVVACRTEVTYIASLSPIGNMVGCHSWWSDLEKKRVVIVHTSVYTWTSVYYKLVVITLTHKYT